MKDGSEGTSTSLIRRAVGRDDEAWYQLVDKGAAKFYKTRAIDRPSLSTTE